MDFLEKIFEGGSIWTVVIILAVVCIVVSIVKKSTKQSGSNNVSSNTYSNGVSDNSDDPVIGEGDKTEVQAGYYRYQDDNQIVIERTEEQKRILNEYFIVRNVKTTTCDSSLRKKAKLTKIISNLLLFPGIVLGVIGYFKEDKGFLAIGIIAALVGIILKFVASSFNKRFEESINVTVAPKKLMTDAEFEKLVDEKIKAMNVAQLGLEKLGLDIEQIKEINPIVLKDKVINNSSLTVRNKKNNSVHSSTQHVTYLYFTDEQLFVYKIQFDMCCNMQEEWASEFFYKDICDVSSYTRKNVLKAENVEYEYSLVSFEIIATNSKIGFDLDGANENVDSIQAMKQKIREKKSQ